MDTLTWEEPLTQRMKVERNLNFSTISNEDDEFGFSRKKTARVKVQRSAIPLVRTKCYFSSKQSRLHFAKWVSSPEKLGREENDYRLVVDGRSSEIRAEDDVRKAVHRSPLKAA
ncbi:hypothetical protein NPIL_572291 [Nephila pilipes]|uniref:Uncharacterized protein n=1 Tax=Nephila pilipes TaxID=299642 RepID=A0A8X6PLR5_NEPPI|nr:hypothetical protein NPIL_572291 [Nephila pilipes]